MRLELATFPVKDVRFSNQTSYNYGVLEIDREELVALILEDKRVASASLDVAFPGEKTRLVNVRDAVEGSVTNDFLPDRFQISHESIVPTMSLFRDAARRMARTCFDSHATFVAEKYGSMCRPVLLRTFRVKEGSPRRTSHIFSVLRSCQTIA